MLALILVSAWGDKVALTRKVVLPDNTTPAVGASVVVRRYGDIIQETKTTTDAQGIFSVSFDFEALTKSNGPQVEKRNGYFIIDMPGYSLDCELFSLKNAPVDGVATTDTDPKLLRLAVDYSTSGLVIDHAGHPIGNAQVLIVALKESQSQMILLNAASRGIITPQMITRTAADGSFHVRGVTATFNIGWPSMGHSGIGPVQGIALALSPDNVLIGENEKFLFTPPNFTPHQGQEKRNDITVEPTIPLDGKITNGATSEPVVGASVTLEGSPGVAINCLPPAITDQQGRYHFDHIPMNSSVLFTLCTAKGLSDGWAYAHDGRENHGSNEFITQPLTGVNMTMRPWVDIPGKVSDETTGQAPVTPVSVIAVYDRGAQEKPNRFRAARQKIVESVVKSDGTFTLHVPTGISELVLKGPGYWSTNNVNAQLKDNTPLLLSVKRLPGVLIRFVRKQPIDWSRCFVFTRNGNAGSETGNEIPRNNGNHDFEWYGLAARG